LFIAGSQKKVIATRLRLVLIMAAFHGIFDEEVNSNVPKTEVFPAQWA